MNKTLEIARFLSYGGEISRTRYWQEANLAAIAALIKASPPSPEELETAPGGMMEYAKRINLAAGVIADVAEQHHGPSVSDRLQTEDPFEAAPGVKALAEYVEARDEE